MRKGGLILLLGLFLGTAGFSGFYYAGTAHCRSMMHEPQPELAWLKKEFALSDAEFARISALHEAYMPQCAERCRVTEQQNRKLKELLAKDATITPEIQSLLTERAKNRAQCRRSKAAATWHGCRSKPCCAARRWRTATKWAAAAT